MVARVREKAQASQIEGIQRSFDMAPKLVTLTDVTGGQCQDSYELRVRCLCPRMIPKWMRSLPKPQMIACTPTPPPAPAENLKLGERERHVLTPGVIGRGTAQHAGLLTPPCPSEVPQDVCILTENSPKQNALTERNEFIMPESQTL